MADAGVAVEAPSDDDLAELEAALAADQAAPPAGGHDALDIDTADHGPTWHDFVDGWDLFRDPILAGGVVGLVLGFLSVYVVLRRMVFVSASVTQAAGFGVAASFYLAVRLGLAFDPIWGATAMSLAVAAVVAPDPRRLGLTREMVLGLVFALCAGGAVLASARIPQEAHDVQAILFGTAVVVDGDDLRRLLISGGAVLSLHLWWFRGFTFASFDPLTARVQGLPVRLLDLALVGSLAVVVGEAARTLGALPAFALSTLPGVAVVQLARGPLIVPFAVAAIFGALAGAGGYVVAFFLELPVGATQAVLAALIAVIATLGASLVGLALRRRGGRRGS